MSQYNPYKKNIERTFTEPMTGRVRRVLQSRLGLWLIAAVSFFESALPVPIITDPFMVAGIMANRQRAAQVVVITVLSSAVGGLAAFAMAAYFFDVVRVLMSPSMHAEFQNLVSFGATDTFVTTVTGALTPVPYTIVAWVVAVAGGSWWVFLTASIVGRGLRYGIVGYCTYAFGPTALRYARRSLTITSVVLLLLVGLYVWLKL